MSAARRRTAAAFMGLVIPRWLVRDRAVGRVVPEVAAWSAALGAGAWALQGGPAPLSVLALATSLVLALAVTLLRRVVLALALAVLGVALAVASLVVVLSVARGFEREVLRAAGAVNGHVLVTEYGLDFDEWPELAREFRGWEGVLAASPFAYSVVALVREDAAGEPLGEPVVALGKGIDPAHAAAVPGLVQATGRGDLVGLRPADSRALPGLVLGRGLARRLQVQAGERVRMVVPAEVRGGAAPPGPPRHATFEVTDLLATGVASVDAELALVHLTAGQALFFGESRVTGLELALDEPSAAGTIAARIDATLPPRFRTVTWEHTHAALLSGVRQVRGAIAVILGLVGLVSGAAIVSGLLLIVRRKREQIAVLLGLGTSPRQVFLLFEVLALAVAATGAACGALLAGAVAGTLRVARWDLAGGVYPVDHVPVACAPVDVWMPIAAVFLVAACAGGPGARAAARTRVVELLR